MSIQTQITSIFNEVTEQSSLLDSAISAIQNKASGGGGENPYSKAVEFVWTAPSEFKTGSTVSISHGLEDVPDGFYITNMELETNGEDYIVSSIAFDSANYHNGVGAYFISMTSFNNANAVGLGYGFTASLSGIFSESAITFQMGDLYGTNVIPAGKQYRVLVYKR